MDEDNVIGKVIDAVKQVQESSNRTAVVLGQRPAHSEM